MLVSVKAAVGSYLSYLGEFHYLVSLRTEWSFSKQELCVYG